MGDYCQDILSVWRARESEQISTSSPSFDFCVSGENVNSMLHLNLIRVSVFVDRDSMPMSEEKFHAITR